MNKKTHKELRFVYRQGIANLYLEGLTLKISQHKIALAYQNGEISHTEFLDRALTYARTR